MRVLVTGAGGFLGSHVARALYEAGFDVTGLDISPGADPDVRWIEASILDAESVEDAVSGQDVVCHLAAVGDVYLAESDPQLAIDLNVSGAQVVGRAAATHGAKLVHASTWEVYGRPDYVPIDELHPCRPEHPYNVTKLAGEQLLVSLANLTGLNLVSLRLGTGYGPGLRPNSVFRIFVDRALKGEPITVQGSGRQGRQFTHARDIARAFYFACRTEVDESVINVVGDQFITIRDLAEAVVARYPTELSFGAARPGDIQSAVVSAERAARILGWRPEVRFEDGLNELLDGVGSLSHD